MGILFKSSIKNIISKPLRTLVLIVCIFAMSLAAFVTVDVGGALTGALKTYFGKALGKTDALITSTNGVDLDSFSDESIPSNTAVGILISSREVTTRDNEFYDIEFVHKVSLMGLDTNLAYNMRLLNEQLTLEDNEVAISSTYSQEMSLAVGDTITYYDAANMPHDFTVKYVINEDTLFIFKKAFTAVMNVAALQMLDCSDTLMYSMVAVSLDNESQIVEFKDNLLKQNPGLTVELLSNNEEILAAASEIISLFAVLLIITFMMVIFITVSLSERIINERMPSIGTLLSLGASRKATTTFLLLENALYGLVGSLIACFVYAQIRYSFISSMLNIENGGPIELLPIEPWLFAVVIIGATVIECVCPIFEVVKAIKTPIRDIIFNNKDTESKISKKSIIIGVALVVIGLCLEIFGTGFVSLTISLVAVITGAALLMPLLMKGVAFLLGKLFDLLKMPVAKFASVEMASKKTTVGSSILCLTAICLTINLLSLSTAITESMSQPFYKGDVIAIGLSSESYMYSFVEDIEGVTRVDYTYMSTDTITSPNANKKLDVEFLMNSTDSMFVGIDNLPSELANNEVAMNSQMMESLGVSVGDTVSVTFKAYSVFPQTLELVVVEPVSTARYATGNFGVLSRDTYLAIYHDYPYIMNIACSNPTEVKATLDKYLTESGYSLYTQEEMAMTMLESAASITSILNILGALGVVLTLIGVYSNISIGFEGRRREFAVLHSTSMNIKQLKRLVFLENLFMTITSIATALILSMVIGTTVSKISNLFSLESSLNTLSLSNLAVVLLILVLMLLATVKPQNRLTKLKTANELKYE